jgi:transposase
VKEKRAAGVLIKELQAEYGLSKATVYRLLAENEEGAAA